VTDRDPAGERLRIDRLARAVEQRWIRYPEMETTMSDTTTGGFTDAERAAMVERAREAKAEGRRTSKADKAAMAEQDALDKIAEMPDADRVIAERIHAIVRENAPDLAPKTWYGMPAYANPDGKSVGFFQAAAKFDARYATLGFNDVANLDDGDMWPASFAVIEMNGEVEKRIAALVKKAVS
jgi:uncharacterized protein YdhG (YjbR/CyaY superfamily)